MIITDIESPLMKSSVIIPTLNEEASISRVLQDLRSLEGLEIIVSDGGSKDSTLAIAESLARVLRSKPGRGIQMNSGAAVASGDILLFLHADTRLPENWKESILSAMSDSRVAAGAFSLSIDSERLSHKIISSMANLRSGLTKIPYGDQGIFVRRSIFEKIGGFKEIPVMEDVDLMRRLKKMGKIVILGEKVKTSARRWEKEGVVYTTIRNWLLIILYYAGVTPERLYRYYRTVR